MVINWVRSVQTDYLTAAKTRCQKLFSRSLKDLSASHPHFFFFGFHLTFAPPHSPSLLATFFRPHPAIIGHCVIRFILGLNTPQALPSTPIITSAVQTCNFLYCALHPFLPSIQSFRWSSLLAFPGCLLNLLIGQAGSLCHLDLQQ